MLPTNHHHHQWDQPQWPQWDLPVIDPTFHFFLTSSLCGLTSSSTGLNFTFNCHTHSLPQWGGSIPWTLSQSHVDLLTWQNPSLVNFTTALIHTRAQRGKTHNSAECSHSKCVASSESLTFSTQWQKSPKVLSPIFLLPLSLECKGTW